jgi:hypothetical protein
MDRHSGERSHDIGIENGYLIEIRKALLQNRNPQRRHRKAYNGDNDVYLV